MPMWTNVSENGKKAHAEEKKLFLAVDWKEKKSKSLNDSKINNMMR